MFFRLNLNFRLNPLHYLIKQQHYITPFSIGLGRAKLKVSLFTNNIFLQQQRYQQHQQSLSSLLRSITPRNIIPCKFFSSSLNYQEITSTKTNMEEKKI